MVVVVVPFGGGSIVWAASSFWDRAPLSAVCSSSAGGLGPALEPLYPRRRPLSARRRLRPSALASWLRKKHNTTLVPVHHKRCLHYTEIGHLVLRYRPPQIDCYTLFINFTRDENAESIRTATAVGLAAFTIKSIANRWVNGNSRSSASRGVFLA